MVLCGPYVGRADPHRYVYIPVKMLDYPNGLPSVVWMLISNPEITAFDKSKAINPPRQWVNCRQLKLGRVPLLLRVWDTTSFAHSARPTTRALEQKLVLIKRIQHARV